MKELVPRRTPTVTPLRHDTSRAVDGRYVMAATGPATGNAADGLSLIRREVELFLQYLLVGIFAAGGVDLNITLQFHAGLFSQHFLEGPGTAHHVVQHRLIDLARRGDLNIPVTGWQCAPMIRIEPAATSNTGQQNDEDNEKFQQTLHDLHLPLLCIIRRLRLRKSFISASPIPAAHQPWHSPGPD